MRQTLQDPFLIVNKFPKARDFIHPFTKYVANPESEYRKTLLDACEYSDVFPNNNPYKSRSFTKGSRRHGRRKTACSGRGSQSNTGSRANAPFFVSVFVRKLDPWTSRSGSSWSSGN